MTGSPKPQVEATDKIDDEVKVDAVEDSAFFHYLVSTVFKNMSSLAFAGAGLGFAVGMIFSGLLGAGILGFFSGWLGEQINHGMKQVIKPASDFIAGAQKQVVNIQEGVAQVQEKVGATYEAAIDKIIPCPDIYKKAPEETPKIVNGVEVPVSVEREIEPHPSAGTVVKAFFRTLFLPLDKALPGLPPMVPAPQKSDDRKKERDVLAPQPMMVTQFDREKTIAQSPTNQQLDQDTTQTWSANDEPRAPGCLDRIINRFTGNNDTAKPTTLRI